MSLRILIIDQCSSDKKESELPDSVDESRDREELVKQDGVPAYKAYELYEGRQQRYISNAVDRLRAQAGDEVRRVFISAGYGVVDEEDLLPPYDTTFSGLSEEDIRTRSNELGIQDDIIQAVNPEEPYDFVFFALGSNYYDSLDMNQVIREIPETTTVVLFNGTSLKEQSQNLISIPARTEQAKEQGTIVVALKGRYLQNFAEHRAKGAKVEDIEDVKEYCNTRATDQSELDGYGNG